jgi:hypothetical protein
LSTRFAAKIAASGRYAATIWLIPLLAWLVLFANAIGTRFSDEHQPHQWLILAMKQPEAYIGNAGELFDKGGKLKNDDTAQSTSIHKKSAKLFSKPGKSKLEILQSGSSGNLAFWTGLRHAEVRMRPKVT